LGPVAGSKSHQFDQIVPALKKEEKKQFEVIFLGYIPALIPIVMNFFELYIYGNKNGKALPHMMANTQRFFFSLAKFYRITFSPFLPGVILPYNGQNAEIFPLPGVILRCLSILILLI
jgi:hypothetical protein